MKTATGLTMIAVGAILAFAVTAHLSFLNIQVIGWVLILTGICGLLVPKRHGGVLRRSVIVTGSPDISADDNDAFAYRASSGRSAPRAPFGHSAVEEVAEYVDN
jgi:hypothetical protein